MANISKEIINMLFDVIRLYTDKSIEEALELTCKELDNYEVSTEETAEE